MPQAAFILLLLDSAMWLSLSLAIGVLLAAAILLSCRTRSHGRTLAGEGEGVTRNAPVNVRRTIR